MMTPLERYQQDLLMGQILPDSGQEQAMNQLQRVYHDLLRAMKQSWWQRFKQRCFWQKKLPVKGLYLWGSVGAGKTYLMDTFFASLPFSEKKRDHFHHFMRTIHQALKRYQGTVDPLKEVAKELSLYKVLCLDEFFVNDIGDAMILGHLLKALFSQGTVVVTTSNTPPDELYKNGLQRDLFMPAIQTIHQYTEVFHIVVTQDYRLRQLSPVGVYFYPQDPMNMMKMRQLFSKMASGALTREPINIDDRLISVVQRSTTMVWFHFHEICHMPRSQQDYVYLAEQFHTVMISDIPAIQADQDNSITYFIHLVDVFYDAKVKLILGAYVALEELYVKGRKQFEFKRTLSRLKEMQTQEYLALPHRAAL